MPRRPAKSLALPLCIQWLLLYRRFLSCFGFAVTSPSSSRRFRLDTRQASSHQDLESILDEDMDEYCQIIDDFGCQAFEALVKDEQNPKENYRWIRFEQTLDPNLQNITNQQVVWHQIETAKRRQSTYGKSELYSRQWQYTVPQMNEPLVNGASVNGCSKPVGHTFTMAQFNALAEGLSSAPDARKPFPAAAVDDSVPSNYEKNPGYGGFTEIPFQNVVLDFSLRRWRLFEVLLTSYRQSYFDIIAMEEVDRYYGFFEPMLKLFGYDSFFAPKTRSPCLPLGWYSDGCALFWKADKFHLVSASRHEYRIGSQVYILVVLRHVPTQKHVVVAVTHLKAQSSASNEKIRCAQVDELLAQAGTCVAGLADDESSAADIPVLFAGDLNADAQCEFDESCIRHHILQSRMLPQTIQSAYPLDPPDPSFYTTWKIRGPKETRRIIDYIFYAGEKLNCTATLQAPAPEEVEAARLPSLRYPSDHVLIAAEFTIQ